MNESYKSFTDLILAPTPTVLGLKMLPYTLGHAILLKKAKSIFVMGGVEGCSNNQILTELVFACLVCSVPYEQFNQEVESGEIEKLIVEYVGCVYRGMCESKTIKTPDDLLNSIVQEVVLFADYLKQGTSTPQFDVILKEGQSESVGTNAIEFEQSILAALMSECNHTRDECLNLPLNETLSAYLLLGHNRGVIELISKEIYTLKEKMKAGF
jgi:hypothetical protein